MTKKLEDLLNLPESKKIVKDENRKSKKETQIVNQREKTMRDISEFDKISEALPQVKGLGELADKELNEVADKAMEAYEDLMDLGMNVESRYSDLQLKKQKQDSQNIQETTFEGEGFVVTDRNSLIEKLKGIDKDK